MKKLSLAATISFLVITPLSAQAQQSTSIEDLEVNKYDCSVEEVKNYMNKRTSSLKRETGVATWSDFKENAVLISDASRGGSVPDGAYQGQSNEGVNKLRDTPTMGSGDGNDGEDDDNGGMFSDCPTFGDQEMDWAGPDWQSIWDNAKSAYNAATGGANSLLDGAQQAVSEAQKKLDEFMDQGFCNMVRNNVDWDSIEEHGKEYAKSMKSEAVEEASARTDERLDEQTGSDLGEWTGYDLEDIEESNSEELTNANIEHNIINSALEDSNNSNGELVNVFDNRLDEDRQELKEDETDRQKEKLTDQILGRD